MTDENPEVEETEETPEEETEETSEDEETEEKPSGDLQKAIARRDRALARARKAEAERDELKAKLESEGEKEESPEVKANRRLVSAEAKAQLAALGVTDKEDVKEVLAVLNLAGIDVDEDGDVDSEEIEERISTLKRVFGGKEKRRVVPRSVTPGDKSKGDTNSDADTARYRRIMGAGR